MNQDDNGITKLGCVNHDCDKCKAQQQEPVRVPVTDNTYNYAKSLAEAIFKQHFASDEHYSSGRIVWGVNDTVIGILTQIDNMVADMVRKPAQQEPVAIEYWLQDTMESGRWVTTDNMAKATAEKMLSGEYGDVYPQGRIVEPSPPASKQWVGLTDEEMNAALDYWSEDERSAYGGAHAADEEYVSMIDTWRYIEAKLKEKNA